MDLALSMKRSENSETTSWKKTMQPYISAIYRNGNHPVPVTSWHTPLRELSSNTVIHSTGTFSTL
jgi:hypothetical protein